MKKIISKILATILLISLMTINVQASTYYEYNSSGQSFSSAWEVTAISTSSQTFLYGYNTFLINEDYTHTFNTWTTHKAKVKHNTNSLEVTKLANKVAKAEIMHGSGTIYYRYTYY